MTKRTKTPPTKYVIVDTIDEDLYDDFDEMKPAEAREAMRASVTFKAKVFKTEDGYKVALAQGDDRPDEYDQGPTAATRAGADALRLAMLEVLNSESETRARVRKLTKDRADEKARWAKQSREQLQSDQAELDGARNLKLEVGDTVILKGYDIRGSAQWTSMLLTEVGLINWRRFGYTSQADAIMYERDEAPGRIIVVKDGATQQVRAGKPRATA